MMLGSYFTLSWRNDNLSLIFSTEQQYKMTDEECIIKTAVAYQIILMLLDMTFTQYQCVRLKKILAQNW